MRKETYLNSEVVLTITERSGVLTAQYDRTEGNGVCAAEGGTGKQGEETAAKNAVATAGVPRRIEHEVPGHKADADSTEEAGKVLR